MEYPVLLPPLVAMPSSAPVVPPSDDAVLDNAAATNQGGTTTKEEEGEQGPTHKQKLNAQWHATYQRLVRYREEVSGLLDVLIINIIELSCYYCGD